MLASSFTDYDWLSGEYSTWTESIWLQNAMSVRLFLVPSNKLQVRKPENLFLFMSFFSLLTPYFPPCKVQPPLLPLLPPLTFTHA